MPKQAVIKVCFQTWKYFRFIFNIKYNIALCLATKNYQSEKYVIKDKLNFCCTLCVEAYKVGVSFNLNCEIQLFLCGASIYLLQNCPWFKVSGIIYKASEDEFEKLPMLSFEILTGMWENSPITAFDREI